MNRTWEVFETEVGSIGLCVYENDDLVYVHTGYQYHTPAQLRNDLAALSGGDDPRSWDGNELITTNQITNRGRELPSGKLKPEERLHNLAKLNIKSKIICDQDGPIPGNMGEVGKRLFSIQDKGKF